MPTSLQHTAYTRAARKFSALQSPLSPESLRQADSDSQSRLWSLWSNYGGQWKSITADTLQVALHRVRTEHAEHAPRERQDVPFHQSQRAGCSIDGTFVKQPAGIRSFRKLGACLCLAPADKTPKLWSVSLLVNKTSLSDVGLC